MMALKRKLEFKTTKSTIKLLLVECFDKKNASGEFVLPSWGFPICFK